MTPPDLATLTIVVVGPAAPMIRRSTATRSADLREILSAMPELAGWGTLGPAGPILAEVFINDRPRTLAVWPSWTARPADRPAALVVPMDRPGWFISVEEAR